MFVLLLVSNTRFIAAVIERHAHSPERRRRYWGRSGTESDHGKTLEAADVSIVRLRYLHHLATLQLNTQSKHSDSHSLLLHAKTIFDIFHDKIDVLQHGTYSCQNVAPT